MKIALIGYGKMGKEIEKIALNRGHEIVSIIDINNRRRRHRVYEPNGSLQQLYESFQSRREIGFRQYRLAGRTW